MCVGVGVWVVFVRLGDGGMYGGVGAAAAEDASKVLKEEVNFVLSGLFVVEMNLV